VFFLFSYDVYHDGLRTITAESARHSSIIRATLLNFTPFIFAFHLLTSHKLQSTLIGGFFC
ncbi:uncharacterized protein C8R40DRAFT_1134525, partial [Lentinula edodes]|uniref:uncharacterized protein n=1 Tax=Lentinula edodes TaxID=5353 RepID=UPI001E8E4CD3